MANGEARTFRKDGGVWTAEVRDQPGPDWFGQHGENMETVVFTRIDAQWAPRAVRIAAGTLNRLSHKEIGELLDHGRIPDQSPAAPLLPLPTGTEPGFAVLRPDEEGMRWAVRAVEQERRHQSGGPDRICTGIDFVCLDDTALRGHFPFKDSTTLHAFLGQHGGAGALTLIPAIKRKAYGIEEKPLVGTDDARG
jgi:hypothetical protein